MNDQMFVLAFYPQAECHGPVKMYWPGQGTRHGRFIVITAPHCSKSFSEAASPEEAWQLAADRAAYEGPRKAIEAAEWEWWKSRGGNPKYEPWPPK